MQELAGKNAFVTGGASGIGLAMAQAFLREGMNVVIVDVDRDALAEAERQLAGSNAKVLAMQLDVTDREQFRAVADRAEAELGPIHVLCNNAGVNRGGSLDAVTYEDWDWVKGFNVRGVVNGIQTLVNSIKSHGEGGHIVNTASMAGVTASPGLAVYITSMLALVVLWVALRLDLEPLELGFSVLCPGMVRNRILESERTRPGVFDVAESGANAAAEAHSEVMQMAMNTGIAPGEVADLVVQGIKENQLYLFPHPELGDSARERMAAMAGAFGEPDPERVKAQQEFMSQLLPKAT